MKIETIEGTALNVRHKMHFEAFPGQSNGALHTVEFNLGGKCVEYMSTEAPNIGENDQAIIAGKARNEKFIAYAYKNGTKGCIGESGFASLIIYSALLLVFGLFFLLLVSNGGLWTRSLFGVAPLLASMYLFYKFLQVRAAYKKVTTW